MKPYPSYVAKPSYQYGSYRIQKPKGWYTIKLIL